CSSDPSSYTCPCPNTFFALSPPSVLQQFVLFDPHLRRAAMPPQPGESYAVNVEGGKGGRGGPGGQGGQGGPGYGPTLNFGPNTHPVINHYHGESQINQDIINWLSPINFFLRQADISELRVRGTGEWLLEHPLFKNGNLALETPFGAMVFLAPGKLSLHQWLWSISMPDMKTTWILV
ncbi:hypothetical protein K438DRAFT_2070280, partial [Mycena galopus ATCC 62051]